MLTRSITTTMTSRAAATRRLRRRAAASARLYCTTNGCTTHLEIDPTAGIARCPVCRAERRIV